MRKTLWCIVAGLLCLTSAKAVPFGKGELTVKTVARNAVRIQYVESGDYKSPATDKGNLPDWLYVRHDEVTSGDVKVNIDAARQTVSIENKAGQVVFTATRHQLVNGTATLAFASPKDECLFGLGQFQDGYANVRGLARRLTQVNTQISIPMLLSSKGYGLLWNNYGLTEFQSFRPVHHP